MAAVQYFSIALHVLHVVMYKLINLVLSTVLITITARAAAQSSVTSRQVCV